VDLTLEAQNQDLLQSMNQRSQMQLQLQQAVEGLSVVAISYYLVGLVKYMAGSLHEMGMAGTSRAGGGDVGAGVRVSGMA
jgi:uncharacterized membrane-anchored protein